MYAVVENSHIGLKLNNSLCTAGKFNSFIIIIYHLYLKLMNFHINHKFILFLNCEIVYLYYDKNHNAF